MLQRITARCIGSYRKLHSPNSKQNKLLPTCASFKSFRVRMLCISVCSPLTMTLADAMYDVIHVESTVSKLMTVVTFQIMPGFDVGVLKLARCSWRRWGTDALMGTSLYVQASMQGMHGKLVPLLGGSVQSLLTGVFLMQSVTIEEKLPSHMKGSNCLLQSMAMANVVAKHVWKSVRSAHDSVMLGQVGTDVDNLPPRTTHTYTYTVICEARNQYTSTSSSSNTQQKPVSQCNVTVT